VVDLAIALVIRIVLVMGYVTCFSTHIMYVDFMPTCKHG